MSRIKPTETQHGAGGHVVIGSDDTSCRVVYLARPAFGPMPARPRTERFVLTAKPQEARDIAAALRLLLSSGATDLTHLPYVLDALTFSTSTEPT